MAGWRVVPVSVTGPEHVRRGAGNQDAFAWRADGDRLVLAVADGAGSAVRSATGARLAVDAACDATAVLDEFGAEPARRYAGRVLGLFDRRLARLGGERGDYATTLIAVVARPPAYVFLAVGDSFLVVEHRDGGAHLVVPPDNGPSLGSTVFLTSRGRATAVRCGVIEDPEITGLALCSDGVLDAVLAAGRDADGEPALLAPADFTAYLRMFADPAARPSDLAERLRSPDFTASSADDKTMVLAVRA
ncbi:PP2C family serine/threonine-protein phosphatase [Paractinoplanes atraurantiacus]|uniref:Serine/threonine protein phosphatase PrpC n=1 Tax=Paractinoplanes atraurantiacus TaxID=1036182 RepID=A0A285KDY8_9ACTN|nr:PP2C family serine/threonine-protein phosphatase [Actinoplanes atraurantiacus]SNY69521.1 Serine/threonine protein phosphatase PrpC [Actinoplanes atraurantiacus]